MQVAGALAMLPVNVPYPSAIRPEYNVKAIIVGFDPLVVVKNRH